MSSLHTQKIELSKQEQTELEFFINKRKSPQSIVFRAKIILSGAQGKSILKTSKGGSVSNMHFYINADAQYKGFK